jgi:pimeloyl-ACP methyl ester carboxylesterase
MASLKEIIVDGHKIVALEFNRKISSIPVIFIHGITASLNFWEPLQIPIIKEKFHWYSLSLPGHYPASLPSDFRKEDMTKDLIGQILNEAIKKLVGDQSYILAGHSTGGFATLQIAANFPEKITGAISISGFAKGKWNGTLGLLQMLARAGMAGRAIFRNNLKILKGSRSIYRIAAGFYAKDRKALYSYPGFESILDIVHRDTKELNHDSLIPYFNRLPDIDISNDLSKISTPTLVLAGKNDPIIPHDQPVLIAEKVQNGELFLIDGCGHLPMFERPVEYNQIITEWIEKI